MGAASHGWKLDERIEVSPRAAPPESLLDPEQQQSLLYSPTPNRATTKQIRRRQAQQPKLVILDSLPRSAAGAEPAAVPAADPGDQALRSISAPRCCCSTCRLTSPTRRVAHGVRGWRSWRRHMERERRRTRVVKYRGVKFRGGFLTSPYHRRVERVSAAVALGYRTSYARRTLSSGIPELDRF
jgi:circadian clock protein KaiC